MSPEPLHDFLLAFGTEEECGAEVPPSGIEEDGVPSFSLSQTLLSRRGAPVRGVLGRRCSK